jgi:hypothetical protein
MSLYMIMFVFVYVYLLDLSSMYERNMWPLSV